MWMSLKLDADPRTSVSLRWSVGFLPFWCQDKRGGVRRGGSPRLPFEAKGIRASSMPHLLLPTDTFRVSPVCKTNKKWVSFRLVSKYLQKQPWQNSLKKKTKKKIKKTDEWPPASKNDATLREAPALVSPPARRPAQSGTAEPAVWRPKGGGGRRRDGMEEA